MKTNPKKSGAIRRFLSSIYWGLFLRLVVLFSLLWLLMWALAGDSIAYWGFVNAGATIIGLITLAVAALFFVRRERYWALTSLALALVILVPGSGHNVGQIFTSESKKNEGSVRILSASLRGLNKDMASAARRIIEYGPDIVAAQEVSDHALLLSELKKASGQEWYMVLKERLAIFSKAPISKINTRELPSVLKAQVVIDGKRISIWTLRAPKNYERPILNSGFYVSVARMVSAENPDILLGDFNSTYWNDGYNRISEQMNNAQAKSGFGFGNSFPARGRISGLFGAYARIDHIFVGRNFEPIAAFTGDASAGADHHPVIADIRQISN